VLRVCGGNSGTLAITTRGKNTLVTCVFSEIALLSQIRVLEKSFIQHRSLRCWEDFALECFANIVEPQT